MRIVIIADMHVGHVRALTPRGMFNKDNTNDFQRWVIEQWEDFISKYKNPDYLILNGDLADGSQVKSLGVDAVMTSLDGQEKMAVELIKPLIGEQTKIRGINGSGYHGGIGQGTCMDRRITEALGGKFVGNNWELPITEDFRIQFAHGKGSVYNPQGFIKSECERAQKISLKRNGRVPRILVRSHLHVYATTGDIITTAYVTPCWEYTTGFMEEKTGNIIPDIGSLIIEIDDDLTSKVYPKTYPIPDEVYDAMRNIEEIQYVKAKKNKEKEIKVWKETLNKQNKNR